MTESTDPYHDGAAVSSTFVQAQPGQVPSATGYTYDGAGRKTAAIAYNLSSQTWRTTYTYGGNFTTIVPPAGATATTSVVDARGHQTDLIQYHAGVPADYVNDPASDYSDTKFTYTPAGKQATETDAAGNTWSWAYNLLGQKTDSYDPDTGHGISTFDNAGQLLTATDARGKQTTSSYDLGGRVTGTYDTTGNAAPSSGNQLTGYVYDTLKKGYPTSATSYSQGDTYTSTVLAYGAYAKPSATKATLTGTDAALVPSTGLTTSYGYSLTGRLSSQGDPAVDGLPQESITYGADNFGEPTSLKSNYNTSTEYVHAVGYSEYGQPVRYTMPAGTGDVWIAESYDAQTQALTDVQTTDSGTSGVVDDLTYAYGNTAGTVSKGSGLLTRIVDSQNSGTTVDTQCFTYDYATRLQQAWSATDQCAATPAPGVSSTVGGPLAPYWQSWTYDLAGDRSTQTDHDVSGNTTNDTTTTYTYPAQGSSSDQPHTLTATTATGPNTAANTASYVYDTAGNTVSITGGALGNQTLKWNDQGKLQSDTTNAGVTNYVYDAAGNVLARRDPASTTLYLGDMQLTDTGSTLSGVRYYALGGATLAERTSTGQVSDLIPDRQGTDQLAINTSTQAVTRRQYTPFGSARGTVPTWVGGDKGYIGGSNDATTGLETLGARDYDPVSGRFISPDPLFEAGDPTQLGGYDYAGNDPVTGSDPTGMLRSTDGGGGGTYDGTCQSDNSCGNGSGSGDDWWADPTLNPGVNQDLANSHGYGGSCTPTTCSNFDAAAKPPSLSSLLGRTRIPTYQELKNRGVFFGSYEEMLSQWAYNQCSGEGNAGAAFCSRASFLFGGSEPWKSCSGTVACLLDIASILLPWGKVLDIAGSLLAKLYDAVRLGKADPEAIAAAKAAADQGGTPLAKLIGDGCVTLNSFVASTRVLMADGTSEPIEQIKVGDKIANNLAGANPDTKDQTHTVTAVHVTHTDHDYTDVTVATTDDTRLTHALPGSVLTVPLDAATATITGTAHHLYWDATTRTWTEADHLRPGDLLQTTDGHTVPILAIHDYTTTTVTYNLTIDTLHTYYVVAGDTPVLVHNTDGCINWSWKSVKTFGHTFNEHGAGAKNLTSLTDRARSTGNAQGQWLDNEATADFLSKLYVPDSGPFGVKLPEGLGRVIMPDGTIVDAPYAYIVPSQGGIIKTAYPTLGEP